MRGIIYVEMFYDLFRIEAMISEKEKENSTYP